MKASFDQIQTVILTEKATSSLREKQSILFRVSPKANKIEIKRGRGALQKTVVNVNTANFTGKKKRERTANFGRRELEKGGGDAQGGRQDRARLSIMALKNSRPLTPSNRFKSLPGFSEITKDKPEKTLTAVRKRTGGRTTPGA